MKVLNNRYEILDTVGQGAAAVVHRVRDRCDGSIRVAKLLHAASAASEETVRRFEDEFRILRGLHHPSLPEVFDYGWTEDKSRFMVMEFVEGQPLDQYINERPEDLWVILYQLCEVLTFIHSHALLHQDVKPANILVKRTSTLGAEMPLCVLIDFGLTYRRDAGEEVVMVGTPEYMAPEIIRGEAPLTRAVDYYSLGVSLYQIIAGQLPFQGSGHQIFDGHLNQPVRFEREKIEYAELYPHIRGLMSKDKRARLESFQEFKRAVIGRMTGGIDELDKAYGLARINSLGMIGKDDVWAELMQWLDELVDERTDESQGEFEVAVLRGRSGSGKSYLLARLVHEAKIMGVNVVFVGRGTQGLVTEYAEQPDYWEALTEGDKDVALVLVDDYGALDILDREVLEYLSDRHAASTIDGATAHVAVLIAGSDVDTCQRVSDDMRRQTSPREHTIPPLSGADHERIVGIFRGNILDASEVTEINHLLARVGDSAEAVLRGLQRAVLDGSLSFAMGNWLAQAGVHDIDSVADNYYGDIVDRLTIIVRDTAHMISCHRGDVSYKMLTLGLKVDLGTVQRACDELESLRLVFITRSAGETLVRCISQAVRERIYGSAPRFSRDDFHGRLLRVVEAMLESNGATAENRARLMGDAAGHAASMRDYRLAMRFLLPAVRVASEDDRIRRATDLVEFGFSLCDSWDEAAGGQRAAAFRRYLIRALLRIYWKRSMHDAIRYLMRKHYADDPGRVPVSFVPIYARALMFGDSTEAADKLLDLRMKMLRPQSQPYLHMKVERALVRRRGQRVQEALVDLDELSAHVGRLDPYYQCRLYVHYLICYDAIGDHEKMLEAASRAEEIARTQGFIYELSIVLQAEASGAFLAYRLTDAMSLIAQGVRLTGKHKLENSRKWFYFEASAVYYERGDLVRCSRYLHYSLQVSQRLGDLVNVVVCLVRAGMIYVARGEYGNAMSYLARAEGTSKKLGDRGDDGLGQLVRFEISLDLNLADVDDRYNELSLVMKDTSGIYRLAHFHALSGDYFMVTGELDRAGEEYDRSMEMYRRAGHQDDQARVAIAAGRLALLKGDLGHYNVVDQLLGGLIPVVGNKDIHAQYQTLSLQHELQQRKGDLAEHAIRCEEVRSNVVGTMHQLRSDILHYAVWIELGNEVMASTAFARVYSNIRRIVSNLPTKEMADRFLMRSDVAAILESYRERSQ